MKPCPKCGHPLPHSTRTCYRRGFRVGYGVKPVTREPVLTFKRSAQ